jgi:hypothetical protein
MLKDVFISYAREDVAIARRLAEALRRSGYTVWWDDEIRAGHPKTAIEPTTLLICLVCAAPVEDTSWHHRTVKTALLLVTLPAALLTITAKSEPLSAAVVGGVV